MRLSAPVTSFLHVCRTIATCFRPALPLLAAGCLIIFASASCGESPMRRTLRQAEAVMEEHPDSAYAPLTGLNLANRLYNIRKIIRVLPEERQKIYAPLLIERR